VAEEEKPEGEGGGDAVDEAAELQKMLGEAEAAEAQSKDTLKKLIVFVKKYKLYVIIGVVVIFLGIVASFLFSEPEITEEEKEEIAIPEISEEDAPEEGPKILNANIYKLESFLLPLKATGEEPDRFVNIKLFFVLSNRKLDKELDKNIQTIRENIYNLLKRKKPKEYLRYKMRIKERLKREIVTVSNSLLASGSGTIQDVLFTEFVVK
jgi:flagellar basal body-associated protein FliL